MPAFKTKYDIVNRGLMHLRVPPITSFSDQSDAAVETNIVYEKLREAELRANYWRFSIRRAIVRPIDGATVLWTPPTYSATTTYLVGHVVVDANGDWWECKFPSTGNAPDDASAFWTHYIGNDAPDPFVPAATTSAPPLGAVLSSTAGGALGLTVYWVRITYVGANGETLPSVETSLTVNASNLLAIASPAASTGMTGYNVYVGSSQGSEQLQNASPITIGTPWTEPTSGLIAGARPPVLNGVTYYSGELVTFGGGVYRAMTYGVTSTPPTSDWLLVNGTTAPLTILYPMGAGPLSSTITANVVRLPHGFLRRAPVDPKAGNNPPLGMATLPMMDDHVYENNYFTTDDQGAILIRFVGDEEDVRLMDPMFCEMFSARIAEECAAQIAKDGFVEKAIANARAHYKDERFKAVAVNSIEVGANAPAEDDYITCRL